VQRTGNGVTATDCVAAMKLALQITTPYTQPFSMAALGHKRTFRPSRRQPVKLSMPFSFLLVLVFMLCAVISPLIAAGVIWALCTERWRYLGARCGKTGVILAAISVATYFSLNALLGGCIPVHSISVLIAGGAGFTAGVGGICGWIWARNRNSSATAD
jgi:hypothetical protein